MTYISRATIGLAKPNGSRSLVSSRVENTAFHYPGMANPINASGADGMRRVMSALRGWQTYHMQVRGWSDIAYCIAIDQVGRKYTLRGINIQSAANGNQDVNERFGAVLLVLGNNEEPSAAMQKAAREVMGDYRVKFTRIPKRPTWHGAIRPGGTASAPSTDCPGKHAIADIKAGRFDAATTPNVPSTPTPPKDEDMPLNQADKDFITGECQRFAVANNEYTRQVLSTSTKAILTAVAGVDEATAAAVDAAMQDDFKRIEDKIAADLEAPKA